MVCTTAQNDCYWTQVSEVQGCTVGCQGVYADISYTNETTEDNNILDFDNFVQLEKEYQKYKQNFAQNLAFDPASGNYSKFTYIF